MNLNIEEIRKEKLILEKEILDFIQEKTNNFTEKHSVPMSSIDFSFIDDISLGEEFPRRFITDCHINIHLDI